MLTHVTGPPELEMAAEPSAPQGIPIAGRVSRPVGRVVVAGCGSPHATTGSDSTASLAPKDAGAFVVVDTDEIERLNILGATLAGMERALRSLSLAPELALIDGNRLPRELPCDARAIVDGDATEPAIGAASILAKIERDRIMRELDALHPGYGFARHKGYSTPEHLFALERLGPCAIHRRGFEPVRRLIAPELF